MDYVHLGRLGLKVSPLCLGTMNFGPETSEQDSFAIMDRALEHGINFFDTANVYAHGRCEEVWGDLLRPRLPGWTQHGAHAAEGTHASR